ncbi:MAG: SPASM domain-containing protein [Butyrivibrio sp.]|nr:SPASM domain-containing protein [Butyrivibrio sp.]
MESENRREIANLYIDAIRFVKNIKKEYANKAEYPQITNFCEFESASYMGCAAGANYISINNDGLVTPCVAVPLSFGNIRENRLKEIFNDMGKYFPRSGKVCYGKTSGKIIQKKKINTDITPISERQSKEVASECIKSESRAAIFDCFVS